jgi:signal transduction histidine kinase/CheY-like chemotaxis protein
MATIELAHSAASLGNEYDRESDLAYFRGEILGPLTLVPAVASLFLFFAAVDGVRFETWLPMASFALVAVTVPLARMVDESVAAVWLTIGLLLSLTVTSMVYPATSLPCLYAIAVAIGSLSQGPKFGLVTALLASGLVLAGRAGALAIATDVAGTSLALAWAVATLFWLATRPVYTALTWAWSSYRDGLRKTEELRDRQGELGRLSKSLQETCVRLEHLNQELERARRAAEEARRAKNELAAAVSHELRTPLNLIIGFSEMMVISPHESYSEVLPVSYRSDVEAIYRNACHISDLIDDILDLSQIDAHRMALHREAIELATVVESAVTVVANLFRQKNLRVEAVLPDGLPLMHVDPARVRQVLINLMANAVRYTDIGGVTVSASQRDREVVIAVADTGVGIDPGEIPHVFETFRHGWDHGVQRAGHGLGLAISKRFVEMHGGSMWVESRVGEGTTFYLSLPIRETTVISEGRPLWEGWMAARDDAKEPTVLVLDDREEVTRLMGRYLEGYRVLTAPDLARTPQTTAGPLVRAVVMTVEGGEPTDYRAAHPEVGRALTVFCPMQLSWAGATELGVADYLVKPVSAAQLHRALRSLGGRIESALIVDDDPDVVRLLDRMIRSALPSCRTWGASDGLRGLEILREQHPDVLLLDLLMPDVDGYAILAEMRSEPSLRHIPVIVITARTKQPETVIAPSIRFDRHGGFTIGEAASCLKAALGALPAAASPDTSPAQPPGSSG